MEAYGRHVHAYAASDNVCLDMNPVIGTLVNSFRAELAGHFLRSSVDSHAIMNE